MNRNSLAVDHELISFADNQRERFMSFLSNVEKNTVVFSVDAPEQLLLNNEYKTISGNSKLTWTSLRQSCNAMSKSFYKLISDISGRSFTNKNDITLYSEKDAAAIFNMVVKRRFQKCLNGKKVIKNNLTNTVESLVGTKYKRLSNFEFIQRVEQALKRFGSSCRFSQATMTGRKLQARYSFCDPLNIDNEYLSNYLNPVHAGVLFSNSEYGDSSVKMTLFFSFGNVGSTIVPYRSSWCLSHKGNDFIAKLEALLVDVDNKRKTLTEDSISEMIKVLSQNNLCVSPKQEKYDMWCKAISKKLTGNRLSSAVAERIIKRTLFSSFENGAFVLDRQSMMSRISERTAMDMFIALLAEGSSVKSNMTVRDNIEQSSFKLLSGKLRV